MCRTHIDGRRAPHPALCGGGRAGQRRARTPGWSTCCFLAQAGAYQWFHSISFNRRVCLAMENLKGRPAGPARASRPPGGRYFRVPYADAWSESMKTYPSIRSTRLHGGHRGSCAAMHATHSPVCPRHDSARFELRQCCGCHSLLFLMMTMPEFAAVSQA